MLFSFLSFVDTRALDLLFRYRSTCLNYCRLGKQLIASKSEFSSFKIGGVQQANAYCHFCRFKRYRCKVVYLLFVVSLLNHMILCIICYYTFVTVQWCMDISCGMWYAVIMLFVSSSTLFSFSTNKLVLHCDNKLWTGFLIHKFRALKCT